MGSLKKSWPRILVGTILTVTFTLGILYRFTALHQSFRIENLTDWVGRMKQHPWMPAALVGIFMLGGLFVFVHAVLLWSTAFLFDPWHAVLYCEMGSMASALTVYGLGRVLRPSVIHRMAGSYFGRVSQALARKGRLTLVILHWFPVCPFSVLNLIAGATQIELVDFVVGTLIGCTPGIFFVCFVGHNIVQIIHHPNKWQIAGLIAFVITAAFTLRALGHHTRRKIAH